MARNDYRLAFAYPKVPGQNPDLTIIVVWCKHTKMPESNDSEVVDLERSFTALGRAILNLSASKPNGPGHSELDRTSYFALVILDDLGPMRVSDLAATIGLDTSTVSRAVSQLSDSQLVEKARDALDGRAQRLAISARGKEILTEACAAKRALLGEATGTWSGEDRRTLADLMMKLADGLRASRPDVAGCLFSQITKEHT